MPTLAEYALPLIKPQGKFVAYKGINYKEELENSKKNFDFIKFSKFIL